MTTGTKSALVVGGAGYVGSHACKAFATAGWRVTTFDNLSTGHRESVKWGGLIVGDTANVGALRLAIRSAKADVVAHFAALIGVEESHRDPAAHYRTNVVGTVNLLDAIRSEGVRPLIFSSTAAVYGDPEATPILEEHPRRPISPYGRTKHIVEQILVDYDAAYGLRHVALRFFNAAGADPDGEIGERHEPETHLVPLALRGARDPQYAFTINGSDFPTPDGSCVRDYVHVADLASAHVAAADYLLEGGQSIALNLGTEAGTSVLEMVAAIERVQGRALPRRQGSRREGDPAVLVAASGRARAVLGWRPRFALSDMVASAARWDRRLARG